MKRITTSLHLAVALCLAIPTLTGCGEDGDVDLDGSEPITDSVVLDAGATCHLYDPVVVPLEPGVITEIRYDMSECTSRILDVYVGYAGQKGPRYWTAEGYNSATGEHAPALDTWAGRMQRADGGIFSVVLTPTAKLRKSLSLTLRYSYTEYASGD